jgi:uridine kinase
VDDRLRPVGPGGSVSPAGPTGTAGPGSDAVAARHPRVSVDDLADRVRRAAPRLGRTRLVVVDGPAGSGKTTLAGRLATALDAPVVHADDLLAGWGDLEGWWARLDEGVLAALAAGRPGRYRRYDWVAGDFAEWHDVPVADHLVVEGCGAARRAADDVAVLRIWVEAPEDVRLRRGLDRDGDHMREEWLTWMAAETAHFGAESTRARADVLVDGCASMEP